MNEEIRKFTNLNGSWWDERHCKGSKLFGRWHTFKTVLNILAQTTPTPKILETGCMRHRDDYGAGNSTLLFADFLRFISNGGTLISVDTNQDNIALAASVLHEQQYPSKVNYNFIKEHSVHYIKSIIENQEMPMADKYFDLIYLDSQDSDPNNEEITRAAQHHQSEETFYALHLQPRFILLDDCDLPFGGKGLLSKQRLWECGHYLLILDDYQSLWMRK